MAVRLVMLDVGSALRSPLLLSLPFPLRSLSPLFYHSHKSPKFVDSRRRGVGANRERVAVYLLISARPHLMGSMVKLDLCIAQIWLPFFHNDLVYTDAWDHPVSDRRCVRTYIGKLRWRSRFRNHARRSEERPPARLMDFAHYFWPFRVSIIFSSNCRVSE